MQEMFNVLSAGPGAWTVLPGGAKRGSSCISSHCGMHNLGIHAGARHQSWSHRLQHTKQSLFLPGVYGRVSRSREERQGHRGCSVALSTSWPGDPSLLDETGAGIIPPRAAPHAGVPALSRLSVLGGRSLWDSLSSPQIGLGERKQNKPAWL